MTVQGPVKEQQPDRMSHRGARRHKTKPPAIRDTPSPPAPVQVWMALCSKGTD